jgi:alcohol dehydrogenase
MNYTAYSLKAGNIKNLKKKTGKLDAPQAQEVQVAVKAIGLNFADVFAIWGLYSATPKGEFIPGLEYAGVVEAIGAEVSKVQVGDRVMGVTRFGGYTTALNSDQRYVIPVPESWSFAEGASYLVQVLTAFYGLKNLGNLQAHYNVLVHSAAGGVGIWANRIAKKWGARTIGSVGNHEKVAFCKKEGYDEVIVRSNNFKKDLERALGGEELNLIMECIGGEIFKIGYDALAEEGRLIIYGSARYATRTDKPNYPKLMYQFFTRPKIDPQKMIELNKGILGFNLIYLYEKAELMHALLQELSQLDLGKPIVGQEFEFDNLPEAIKIFQSGKTMGKVVVNV